MKEEVIRERINDKSKPSIVVVSTPQYRFGYGFTLISMVWTVKNDLDAVPFNLPWIERLSWG